jgi:hypothetical protein
MDGRRSAPLAAAALLALGLAGCGGGGEVAKVGGQSVTRDQVERMVEHGQEEAKREGADYPARGSEGWRALEQEALAIIVARAQIVLAAKQLGITVSRQELDSRVTVRHPELVEALYEGTRRRLGIPERNEKGESAQLLQDAIRVQLTLQKVERRIGAGRLQAWVEQARRRPVRYADGWAPA